MPGLSETRVWSTFLSATKDAYQKRFTDNIADNFALLSWLTGGRVWNALYGGGKERAMSRIDSGESITFIPFYSLGTTAAARAYTAQVPTTPQDPATKGRVEWAHYSDSVVLWDHEIEANSGEAQVVRLLEIATKRAEVALRNAVSTDLFGTNGDTGPNLNGLGNILSTTTTAHLLSGTTYSWWQADVNTPSPTSFASNGLAEMNLMFVDQKSLGDGTPPEFIVTTPTVYAWFYGVLQVQQRFPMGNQKLIEADPAFVNLMFHSAPVVPDKDCTSGDMYFLNSDSLHFSHLKDNLFKIHDFRKPEDQFAQVALVKATIALWTDQRRKVGMIDGFTA